MGWNAVNSLLYDLQNFERNTASGSGTYNLRSETHSIHQLKSCIASCESFIDVSKIPTNHREGMEQDIAQYETVKGPYFLVKKRRDPIVDSILSHLRLYITALEAEKERIIIEAEREKRGYSIVSAPAPLAPMAPPAQPAPAAPMAQAAPRLPTSVQNQTDVKPEEDFNAFPLMPQAEFLKRLYEISDILGRKGRALADASPKMGTIGERMRLKGEPDKGYGWEELRREIDSDPEAQQMTLLEARKYRPSLARKLERMLDSDLEYFKDETSTE